MREILFKAKHIMFDKWYEGYYVKMERLHYICVLDEGFENGYRLVEINPETLCQYTGLKDENGNKIWENDILKGYDYPYLSKGEHNYFAEVTWFDNCHAFGLYTHKNPKSKVRGISEGNTEFMEDWNCREWEVIGNIFDNPELVGCE